MQNTEFFFNYLFLAVWGLPCCTWAFSSCGERGLLLVAMRGLLIAVASPVAENGLQAHRLQLLWHTGSALWSTGPGAPRHVGSSQTRAQTRVPCPGRRALNHRATREAPEYRIFFGKGTCGYFHNTGLKMTKSSPHDSFSWTLELGFHTCFVYCWILRYFLF